MAIALSWTAPIEPGRCMMGLNLGMPIGDVRQLLGLRDGESKREVVIPDAPPLLADCVSSDVIYLRTLELQGMPYDWQDKLGRLVFRNGVLASVIAETLDKYSGHYGGKWSGVFGLESPVSDAIRFSPLDYDDAEELFYFPGLKGIEIGGQGACDLSVHPEQVVTLIRVY